jgi:hypothetical protein
MERADGEEKEEIASPIAMQGIRIGQCGVRGWRLKPGSVLHHKSDAVTKTNPSRVF